MEKIIKVKVKDSDQIVKSLHGKIGTLIEEVEVKPPYGQPYKMRRVYLDSPVNVGGNIIMRNLFMPVECFEVVT